MRIFQLRYGTDNIVLKEIIIVMAINLSPYWDDH